MSDNETTVRTRIQEIVLDLAPNPDNGADAERNLVDDLEYHSLALLELAFALEDEFDLPPIEEEEAQDIRTVKDIQDYVLEQLETEPAAATA